MISEIIDAYKKEYGLYRQIYDILYKLDRDELDENRFEVDIQNIDYILGKITTLNERTEQLKEIYVDKKKITDFIGPEIKKVENEERYEELKSIFDDIGDIIASVKKLQDKVISKMSREVDIINKIIKENRSKKLVEYINIYNNNKKINNIDKK